MSRPSLPPDEARDWNKVLTRIENLENKVRVLASQDTPTKFGDLDDVDTIFAADQSVATFVRETGKVEMRPGALSTKSGFYDDSFATTVSHSGSFGGQPVPWPALASGDALLDLSTPTIPTVIEDGYYTLCVTIGNSLDDPTLQWAALVGALHIAGPSVAGFVQDRGLGNPFNAVSPASLAGLTFTAPLLAGDEIIVQVSGGGASQDFALSATVSKIGPA